MADSRFNTVTTGSGTKWVIRQAGTNKEVYDRKTRAMDAVGELIRKKNLPTKDGQTTNQVK